MEAPFARSIRRVGLVALLTEEGKAEGKGTAFFVKVGNKSLVLTARHVVRIERDDAPAAVWPFTPRSVRLMVFSRDADLQSESQPIGFPLTEADILWEDPRLDAVAFAAPAALVANGECDFPDVNIEEDFRALQNIRARPSEIQTRLPCFIAGFPNLTHVVDTTPRMERLGFLRAPAFIQRMPDSTWDGLSSRAPQVEVRLEFGDLSPMLPTGLTPVAARWAKLLTSVPENERPLLGGFSGGPVFIVHEDGETVLGIMKEGGPRFEDHIVAWLSPWDDVLKRLHERLQTAT